MLIVSQDKTRIINFDNIDNIKIEKTSINETKYTIDIETTQNYFGNFASYDTKERAEGVFYGIIAFYKFHDEYDDVYEMPAK